MTYALTCPTCGTAMTVRKSTWPDRPERGGGGNFITTCCNAGCPTNRDRLRRDAGAQPQ